MKNLSIEYDGKTVTVPQAVADQIHVDTSRGPIGAYGFRSGNWTIEFQGREYTIVASVPHALPLDEQEKLVKRAALVHLLRADVILPW